MFVNNLSPINNFLSRKHHAAGQGYSGEQVVEFGCAAHFVVSHVGLQVAHDVRLLQRSPFFRQSVVAKQLFVGPHGAVYATNLHTLHPFPDDNAHRVGRIFGNGVILRCADDAGLVQSVQSVAQCFHLRGTHSGYALGVIGMQLVELPFFHCPVIVVIRLEKCQERVAFLLYHAVALINGEVVFGNERTIHPRFAHIVSHLWCGVAWQEPHNDQKRNEREAA